MRAESFYLVSAIGLLAARFLSACSSGPHYRYRHHRKKLSPLVQGQFVPDISENTIGASGPRAGRIRAKDSRFRDLVHNYNPSIIFSDMRGDGRIMTQRCRDKLDDLSFLVESQWPGVRLRVTLGWSGRSGGRVSLHQEGRAVDFTTSDRDVRKYGMLARLAVEAGFDWVHYETRLFVHASVRSDAFESSKFGGCFPENNIVYTTGYKPLPLRQLVPGDRVLAADRETGRLLFSDVIMMMHKETNVSAEFANIRTDSSEVTLTKNHLVFILDRSLRNQTKNITSSFLDWSKATRVAHAGEVQPNDYVFTTKCDDEMRNCSDSLSPSRVLSVRTVVRKGVIAPLTAHGTVVVNMVASSCYSSFYSEPIAHAAFFPFRILGLKGDGDPSEDGMHWYPRILSYFATSLFPSFFRFV